MKSRFAEFRSLYGGDSFLAGKGYLVAAAMALVGTLAFVQPQGGALGWAQDLGATILALGVCAMWFQLCSKVIFRSRATNPASFWAVVWFGAVLGALKALATSTFLVAFSRADNLTLEIQHRLPAAIFLGISAALGLTLQEKTYRSIKDQHRQLLAEVERLRQQLDLPPSREQSIKDLIGIVTKARTRLAPKAEGITAETYAQEIRSFVDNELRPLSHRLWEESTAELKDLSFGKLSQYAVTQVKSKPYLVSALYFFGVFFTLATRIDVGVAAFGALAETLVVLLGLLILKNITQRSIGSAWWFFVFSNLVIAGAAFWVFRSLELIPPEMLRLNSAVGGMVLLVGANFLTRFLDAAVATNEGIRGILERLIRLRELDSEFFENSKNLEKRELADFLHGRMQNVFLAAALRSDTGPVYIQNADLAVDEVNAMLDSAVCEFTAGTQQTLEDALVELTTAWAGFVTITWQVTPVGSSPDSQFVPLIAKISNEAVTNAVRHGLAENIQLDINCAVPRHPVITVTDDGIGPKAGKPGLGSQLLNASAGTAWTLELAPEGGAVLRVPL